MRRFLFLVGFLWVCAAQVAAQQSDLIALETRQASRGWEAVGRLDIRGRGFCTAALIQDRLILTAAHCLYASDGSLHDTSLFEFRAGLRGGRANATRRISRAIAHPNYRYLPNGTDASRVAMDIAVLELSQPIRTSGISPFAIAPNPLTGDDVGVVSYGRGREEAASLQEVCSVLGRRTGVIVMNCDVEFGSSGSPVFSVKDGQTRIASVVSAMAQVDGQKVALGTSLDGPLSELLAHFAAFGPARPGGTQRFMRVGETNDTGAKFVGAN